MYAGSAVDIKDFPGGTGQDDGPLVGAHVVLTLVGRQHVGVARQLGHARGHGARAGRGVGGVAARLHVLVATWRKEIKRNE